MLSPSTTGKSALQGGDHGTKRIATADLADHNGVDLLPEVGFQRAHGAFDLLPFLQLLVADGWRAHTANSANQRIVGHFIRLNDGN